MYTLSTAVRVTFLIVWLTVGVAYIGPATSQTVAPAGRPPTDPFLGLDTGVHTAQITRIGI